MQFCQNNSVCVIPFVSFIRIVKNYFPGQKFMLFFE